MQDFREMNDNVSIDDAGKGLMSLIVRCIGLFLLFAGLWVALQVMLEAYNLYREPQRIEHFALAIEKGSNIDKSLISLRDEVIAEPTEKSTDPVATILESNPAPTYSSNNIRVSYFFAWVIVLLLMLLIARISLSAIKTGGELVLYDMQIKQFARMLVKESSKNIR
ncbi:MAG: hypothetical protein HW411_984 [Gammaproteobacteria bacterium]|nr:hypothetical protein [Gammaproteobacteria bacterium]